MNRIAILAYSFIPSKEVFSAAKGIAHLTRLELVSDIWWDSPGCVDKGESVCDSALKVVM